MSFFITIILSESLDLYNGNFCQQIDGVAMGSLFKATLPVIFLCLCFYKQGLRYCPTDSKTIIYRAFNSYPDFEISSKVIILKDILKDPSRHLPAQS